MSPHIVIDGERRYSVWNGNPNGTPEDPTRCIEEVWPTDCKQHAKKHEHEATR